MHGHACVGGCIVHPESFRSNAQIAIAFARRNRPRVNRSDEFVRTVCNRPRARAFTRTCVYMCAT